MEHRLAHQLWARLGDGKHAYEIYHRLLSYVSPEEYHGPDAVHRGGTIRIYSMPTLLSRLMETLEAQQEYVKCWHKAP